MMDRVLIVDDHVELLNALEEGLRKYRGQFNVVTALDGQEAISMLRKEPISVLVTDLVMPKKDGVELLAHMTKRYPRTPCIVMTEQGSPKIKKRGGGGDVLQFIEKPFNFNQLGGAIIGELDRIDEGDCQAGVSVSGFLQLIEIKKKTCQVEVHCRDKGKGFFHFDRGMLRDARCEGSKGEDAASRMMGRGRVGVRLRSLSKKNVRRRINRELSSLIMADA